MQLCVECKYAGVSLEQRSRIRQIKPLEEKDIVDRKHHDAIRLGSVVDELAELGRERSFVKHRHFWKHAAHSVIGRTEGGPRLTATAVEHRNENAPNRCRDKA